MANYSLIDLSEPQDPSDFADRLELAIDTVLKAPWALESATKDQFGRYWFISLPGTAPQDEAAARAALLPMGENIGFMVALMDHGRRVAFRHPPNAFERWAQGCIEEELCAGLGAPLVFDATGRSAHPGEREYSLSATYVEYLARRLGPPTSDADRSFYARYLAMAPAEHL